MRTFKLIGMALIAVFTCVNFTACSSDDDEADTSIEGTWYLSSEIWYAVDGNGTPDMSKATCEEEYPYHSDKCIWIITKSEGNNYTIKESKYNEGVQTGELEHINKNTYKDGYDRLVIKSVTSDKMVIEYTDAYYNYFDESGKRKSNRTEEDVIEAVEFGYYTFTR